MATTFKNQLSRWTSRERRFGLAAVGRADEDHAQQGERIQQQLIDILPDRFYHHVLDYGAGWGRFTETLETLGSHVWAVDIVAKWLVEAKKRSKIITTTLLDSPILPFDSNSMDLVVDIMTIQSIEDDMLWVQCVRELQRVAAPGATMVSLHKVETRSPALMAEALGLERAWSAYMTSNIDDVDDMYYFLLGRRAP